MSNRSVASILAKLNERSQSNGWNAIVAYDKTCANTLLAQEYISRFSADSYLTPITAKVPSTQDEHEYVVDFVLDRPRLSFEKASVKFSTAKLVVKVVGGLHLTTREPLGKPEELISLAAYDTLGGPELRMGMSLNVLLGTVDIEGRIAFDLSKGTEITLTYSQDPDKRRLGGEFFRAYFEKLPDEQKIFVLNEIKSSEAQYLNPANVQIRTQSVALGAGDDEMDDGSGAILLFITMKGEDYGTFPEADAGLAYLIPDDAATPCTTAILLDNAFFMRKFVEEGFRLMTQSTEPCEIETTYTDPDAGFVASMSLVKGTRKGPGVIFSLPHIPSLRLGGLDTPMAEQDTSGQLAGSASFTLTFEGDAFTMEWTGQKPQDITIRTEGDVTHTFPLPAFWMWRRRYVFHIDEASNDMTWVPAPEGDQTYYKVTPGDYAGIVGVSEHFAEISSYVENLLCEQLQSCVDDFVSPLKNVDVFRLNSILFREHHVMRSVNAYLPGDVIIFGTTGADVSAFILSPVEPLSGPGEGVQFAVSPPTTGLEWDVALVPGSAGKPGIFDAETLIYTAPQAADIEGFFSRVKVTAKKGGYSSSALVTVVVRDISFNPLVAVCGVGERREMSARGRMPGTLEWSIAGPETGSDIVPSSLPEGDHTYIAPPQVDKPASLFTVEEVQVKQGAMIYSSYVLVIHRPAIGFITIKEDAELEEGQLQLQVDIGNGPVVGLNCTWTLKGSGNVDAATGLYTADPASPHRFSLITVEVEPPPGFPSAGAFIILPVPYVDWKTIKELPDK
ncbi:hypothetical protein AFK24_15245 [Pseudomonas syringae]|uniref:Imidazoleglycerol-phosphate synthase n=1 Tax=Pseudomonas syringae TaxID=317 RepID=A0A1C7Z3Z5_PSESX|nr:hypothetical protein [Pseudomonas syringae]OCR24119.1 hypothetical protein AFK24_15245 [Pseudomonas syringae]